MALKDGAEDLDPVPGLVPALPKGAGPNAQVLEGATFCDAW